MLRYELEPSSIKSFSGITVKYKPEDITEGEEEFIYFKGTNKVYCGNITDDLFYIINAYFDSLGAVKQKTHWEYLKAAKRIIEPGYFDEPETPELEEIRRNNLDYKFLCDRVFPILESIYKNITVNDIVYAAEMLNCLTPPDDLNDATNRGDYPEETTIDDSKYIELASLALGARLTLPIFNEFANHITDIAGKNHKYSVIGDMFCQLSWIKFNRGYRILNTYVENSLNRHEAKRVQVKVVSDVKLISNIVSKGILNKLALTFIPSKVGSKNLSNELNSLVTGENRTPSGVNIKSISNSGNEKNSLQESYKIAQKRNASDELAYGEYFTFDLIYETEPGVYAKKENDFFKYQCIGLGIKNQYLAEKIYNTLPNNRVFHLTDSHIKVLQLVYEGDIQYGLFKALDFDQLMCCLSLAQMKLFELGFEQLAVFITSIRIESNATPHLDDIARLNTLDREMLSELCSHCETTKGTTTDNSAVISISEFIEEVVPVVWSSNITEGLLRDEKYTALMAPNHEYEVTFDYRIKDELIALTTLINNKIED